MKALLIGDVMGKPGRKLLQRFLPEIAAGVDLVVANAENAAHGFGVTPDIADELFAMGIHVLTSGNHIWDKSEIVDYIAREKRLLRPANYAASSPGRGFGVYALGSGLKAAVVNLQGRVFMGPCDDPFYCGMATVELIRKETPLIFVDMHGEASSEKQAMGCYLDGIVSAVFGTHTHVPTADWRILPGGTAFVTDLGMTGPYDSVIGMQKELSVRKFVDQMPVRFHVAKENPILHAMLVEVDDHTGKAVAVEKIVRTGEA